jgi:hypothetical protein
MGSWTIKASIICSTSTIPSEMCGISPSPGDMPLAPTGCIGKSCQSPYQRQTRCRSSQAALWWTRRIVAASAHQANPPLVAIYAVYYRKDSVDPNNGTKIPLGTQAQDIAFSTDRGRTWTPYAKNPVLNPNNDSSIVFTDFRDPKVFWYEPTQQWIMAVALSAQHQIRFYSSTDLKNWTKLSDFGPANAVGGVWECPDLFELPVDGGSGHEQSVQAKDGDQWKKPGKNKWVLVVNVNPGAVAGGSGAQLLGSRLLCRQLVEQPS